jgi:gas vesicle protein
MDSWIGIIGTLLGGVVGAGATYLTANAHARRQMKWESVKLTQSKLEELAQVLDEVAHHYRKISGDALMRVQFGKPYQSDGSRIPHSRLAMLVHFYAPELIPDLGSLTKATNSYGETLAEAIRDVERNAQQKQDLTGRLLKGAFVIENQCEKMSRKAADVATAHIERLTANNSLQRSLDPSAIFAFAKNAFRFKRR